MIILMSFFLSSLICSISCFILIINSLLFYLFLREFCLSQSCLCGFFRILPMSHLHCSSFPLRKDFSALPQSFPALSAKSSQAFWRYIEHGYRRQALPSPPLTKIHLLSFFRLLEAQQAFPCRGEHFHHTFQQAFWHIPQHILPCSDKNL